MTDRVLLERHARGDEDAFTQLVKTYAHPIYGYLAASGVPATDREDLFQEVFVKVHRAVGRRMPAGPVRPWLFRIAVNTARDHFRRRKVRSIVTLDERAGHDATDHDASRDPSLLAQARETAAFLDAHIARLPLAQREALLLCGVQGLALKDAAVALDAPVDTVKTRLRRARRTLADVLQRRGRTSGVVSP